jgi:hypothetical protein
MIFGRPLGRYLTGDGRYEEQDGLPYHHQGGLTVPRANGTFDIDSWEPQAIDERDGATLNRVHLTKTFHGDLEGTSTADILTVMAQVEGSAAYVGFERFTGGVHGRASPHRHELRRRAVAELDGSA